MLTEATHRVGTDRAAWEGFEKAARRTAGPSTALLRSSGRDDKQRGRLKWELFSSSPMG
jgi:hypothetical protein